MSYNDYLAVSNNSINDNKLNAKKARSTIHQLKYIIKPLLAMLKKSKTVNSNKKAQHEFEYIDNEIEDNLANEKLENQLFEEMESCGKYAAVPVYSNGQMDILPVQRGQRYIPVHFAKTEAGTFFWTSTFGADRDIDNQGDENAITNYQHPELQVHVANDRWAQA